MPVKRAKSPARSRRSTASAASRPSSREAAARKTRHRSAAGASTKQAARRPAASTPRAASAPRAESRAAVEKRIAGFLARYTPEVAAFARAVRRKLRARIPGAHELVYDNYNALVFGFSATPRPSEAVLSVVPMPRWVTVCFLFGARFPDPKGVLRGEGNQVRHIRLERPADFDRPDIRHFVDLAIARSKQPFAPRGPGAVVIQSVSAKQRPRRTS